MNMYMTYLVYICIFHEKKYTLLLDVLFDSLSLYCKNDSSFDILIYTSSKFRDVIITLSSISKLTKHKKIIFHLNDHIKSKEDACCSRLDVFDFPQIKNYTRVLYLDTDVIVQKKLRPLFNLVNKEKLYALKECENILEFDSEYFGKSLFGNEIYNYGDKSGFNSGVLLFSNCQAIKNLFSIIKVDIKKRKSLMFFYDQPFIIYNTKKLNLSDNITLINHVAFSHKLPRYYFTSPTIIHFSGGVDANNNKVTAMRQFLATNINEANI